MTSVKILHVFCVAIILAIVASGSAKSKVKTPSPVAVNKEEIEKIKNKKYNGYAECKEEVIISILILINKVFKEMYVFM